MSGRASVAAVVLAGILSAGGAFAAEDYVQWQREGYAIPRPLAGLKGDAARGRALVIDRAKGNCLACHRMPIPGEEFQGTVGPPLHGVASRLSEGELRLRVVDEKQLNPTTIQEVEDVVAYLLTLREPGVPQPGPAPAVELQGGPVSGSAFLSEATRQMQEDDFANPGMTTVEYGRSLFHKSGEGGTRCADCHGEEGGKLDRKAIARFPRWSEELERPITLQEQINICWEEKMDNFPYVYDCKELVGLETYVRYLARGETIDVETEGRVRPAAASPVCTAASANAWAPSEPSLSCRAPTNTSTWNASANAWAPSEPSLSCRAPTNTSTWNSMSPPAVTG